MKLLRNYIKESLIKSYDTEKLKKYLKRKYRVIDFHDYDSVNVHRFVMTIKNLNNVIDDVVFYKTIDLYGYVITEINYIKSLNVYDIHLEPNFGVKCNDFIYNQCNGIIWHVTSKTNEHNIDSKGIRPFEGTSYRIFNERTFFVCGETKESIIENINCIMDQLRHRSYVIYKINLCNHRSKPYNVNFYHDTSNPDNKNCIYSNAVFFPHLIERKYYDMEDIKNDLNQTVIERCGRKIIIRDL